MSKSVKKILILVIGLVVLLLATVAWIFGGLFFSTVVNKQSSIAVWHLQQDGTRSGDDFVSLLVNGNVDLNLDFHNSDGELTAGEPVTWRSANPAIASVDKHGLVRGLSPGSTAVDVRTENGELTQTLTVNVFKEVKQMNWNDGPAMRVKVGKTIPALSIGTNPEDVALVWISQRPDLAQIMPDGSIKGITKGLAPITVVYGYSFTDYTKNGMPGGGKPLVDYTVTVE